MSELAAEVRKELNRRRAECYKDTSDENVQQALDVVVATISSYEDSDIENVAALIESDDYNEVCDSLIQSFGTNE